MHNGVYFALFFAGGAVVGGAGTYYAVKKQLMKEMQDQLTAEIEQTRKYYAQLQKKDEYADPVQVLQKKAEELGYTPYNKASEVVEEVEEEFAPGEEEDCEPQNLQNPFVYEEEIQNRSADRPYIITSDEFFENETEYSQSTLTYYEGDEVLTDEKDDPIPNLDSLVGSDNLMRFGHGSDQEHCVYIRNDSKQLEFEVTRSTGKYSEEVLGFIEHSEFRPKIRKFRGDDE